MSIGSTLFSRFLNLSEQYAIPVSAAAVDQLLQKPELYTGALKALDRDSFSILNRAKTLNTDPHFDVVKANGQDTLILRANNEARPIPTNNNDEELAAGITKSHIEQLKESEIKSKETSSEAPKAPTHRERRIFTRCDPFTREETTIKFKPPMLTRAEQDAIFHQGWSRLQSATSYEEKQQALNAIIYSVEPNTDGACIGISRAIVERLSTGKPAYLTDYQHLNRSIITSKPHKLLYCRNESEKNLATNGRQDAFTPEKNQLYKNLLEEFNLNDKGVIKGYDHYPNIEKALKEADHGTIAYILQGHHILPVVNVKGDIFAIPNFAYGPARAEKLTAENCHPPDIQEELFYAITNQKIWQGKRLTRP